MIRATGEHYELTRDTPRGRAHAVITQVAAGILRYRVGDIDLTEPNDAGAMLPARIGTVMAPWANRIRDGRWTLHGRTQQLALTEPERGNALHGLLSHTEYRVLDRAPTSLCLGATIFPQPGYPFLVETAVRYQLLETGGLMVTHSVVNRSLNGAPVALGAHPFLRFGETPVEELIVQVDASLHSDVDDRGNYVLEHPVDGTEYDLRAGIRVGARRLDDCWSGLRLSGGRFRHTLSAADGSQVQLWADQNFPYVHVFLSRTGPQTAIAIEPMTAGLDALNTGQGLRWLRPGEAWALRWGISFQKGRRAVTT